MRWFGLLLLSGYNITQLELSTAAPVDYLLLAGDSDQPLFSVSSLGQLYLSAALDREQTAGHTVGVVARSRASPLLSTLTSISVVVLDVNDNRPAFLSKAYHATVSENVAVGSSVMQGISGVQYNSCRCFI